AVTYVSTSVLYPCHHDHSQQRRCSLNRNNDRPDRQTRRTTVNSEKQQDKNRELTNVELDAVGGTGGGYAYNPATPTFMNPEYQSAIAQSHGLSAIYIPEHPNYVLR